MKSPNNSTGKYILDENRRVVPEPHLLKWAQWIEKRLGHVADERIGCFRISTIFLGLDQSDGKAEQPILWETMVFVRGKANLEKHKDWSYRMDRCAGTWEQAEAMHAAMVKRVTDYRNEKRKAKRTKVKHWEP